MESQNRPARLVIMQFAPLELPQRAFAVERFRVLCPICSYETGLPKSPRVITTKGDGVFICKGCKQKFLYNPFVDKPREEILEERKAALESKMLFLSFAEKAFCEAGLDSLKQKYGL